MKALVYRRYGGPDVLDLAEMLPPQPREHEVLVRVHATSINAGDRLLLRGKPFLLRLAIGLRRPRKPILGLDLAGRVEAVGGRVTRFGVGDDVFGATEIGAFAEYACINAEKLVPKPAGVSFDDAAATPTAGITALQGLRKGRISEGQEVLIDGASGGVGTFAIQIANAYGAKVTAVCSTRNVEAAHALGASHVIDYQYEDFIRSGRGYDLILAANAYRPLSDYRRALKPAGRFVMTGGGGVQLLQTLLTGTFVSITSSQSMGGIMAIPREEDLLALSGLLATGKVKPVIERTVVLNDVPGAIRYLDKEHAQGKIVVRVEPPRDAINAA